MSGDTGSRERYSAGYGPLVIEALASRELDREAGFLLPHLAPGMTVLDCGCGPGTMTVELARRVEPGNVVGIDRHGDQLAVGRARAAEAGVANVRYQAGDIYDLPFPDASFDAVLAHAVIYHLSDPQAALAEIRRVLRPGGVVGIRDADFDRDILYPTTPALDEAMALVRRVLEGNGAQIEFGRRQREALRLAGFTDIVASASYDHFGTPDRTRAFGQYWVYYLSELHRETILAQGWSTEDGLEETLQALQAWGENPDAFYARSRCEAVGRKP